MNARVSEIVMLPSNTFLKNVMEDATRAAQSGTMTDNVTTAQPLNYAMCPEIKIYTVSRRAMMTEAMVEAICGAAIIIALIICVTYWWTRD